MIAETFRLATDYRDTQARLGAVLSTRSLAAWSRVSPRSLAETGGVWLATVLALVRQDRARSRETAAAFYRLQRAVETGHTVPPLHGGYDAHAVPLGDLRAEWAQAKPACPPNTGTTTAVRSSSTRSSGPKPTTTPTRPPPVPPWPSPAWSGPDRAWSG